MTPHLRLVRGDEHHHLASLAVQAAQLAVRLMERGDLRHALDALHVARTVLEHVQGGDRGR